MIKNIIVCTDGTWDGADEKASSNVLKLFKLLEGAEADGTSGLSEQTKQATGPIGVTQIARYIHGVGDSRDLLHKWMGGSIGTGLVARLLHAYTFVSKNYNPDDEIILVGFSRGAYTARALGGFICTMGLLDWQDIGFTAETAESAGYPYAAAAWHTYQQQRRETSSHRDLFAALEGFAAEIDSALPFRLLKPKYTTSIAIKAIGVWDTVGALGIPELTADHGARLDLLRFVNTKLSERVQYGFHAIAADEQRIDFSPTLWDSDPPRITQRFFPGAHADVGGGYPSGDESRLSDGALEWMIERLASCGVRFQSKFVAPPDFALGPMHMPWTSAVWQCRPTGPREFPVPGGPHASIDVHPAVAARLHRYVSSLTDTTPSCTHLWPYLPLALVNAGYINITGVCVHGEPPARPTSGPRVLMDPSLHPQ